jgi:hypothetical protein
MFTTEPLVTVAFAKFSATRSVKWIASHTGLEGSLSWSMLLALKVRFRRPPYDLVGIRFVGGHMDQGHIEQARLAPQLVVGFDS